MFLNDKIKKFCSKNKLLKGNVYVSKKMLIKNFTLKTSCLKGVFVNDKNFS